MAVVEEGVGVLEEGVAEEEVEPCETGAEVEFDVAGFAGGEFS